MKLEPIDTNTTAGKARVMQLAAEGRTVVCGNNVPPWKVITDVPSWDWSTFQYGILAEQIGLEDLWVLVDPKYWALCKMYATEVEAVRAAGNDPTATVVRYRRVEE